MCDKFADRVEPLVIIEEKIEQINSAVSLETDSSQEKDDGASNIGSVSHADHVENVSTPNSYNRSPNSLEPNETLVQVDETNQRASAKKSEEIESPAQFSSLNDYNDRVSDITVLSTSDSDFLGFNTDSNEMPRSINQKEGQKPNVINQVPNLRNVGRGVKMNLKMILCTEK